MLLGLPFNELKRKELATAILTMTKHQTSTSQIPKLRISELDLNYFEIDESPSVFAGFYGGLHIYPGRIRRRTGEPGEKLCEQNRKLTTNSQLTREKGPESNPATENDGNLDGNLEMFTFLRWL